MNNPETSKKYWKKYYPKNKDKIRLSARNYYQKNKSELRIKQNKWRKENFYILSAKAKQYRNKIKFGIYEILGMTCVRCGFNDIRALQIDHINGGGVKEKREVGTDYFKFILKQLVENNGKDKYQILCANCNWIKRSENNECRKRKNES